MTETQPTADDNGSWLLEYFKDMPEPTTEETAAHKAVAKEVSKVFLSDEQCRAKVDAILKASSQDVCPKCKGSGFVGYRRAGGVCFRCDGVGFLPKN